LGAVRTWVTLLVQDIGNTCGIDVGGFGGGLSRGLVAASCA